MGPPFLIIDGYNLLHAAGLARLRYAPGDLERARYRLLGMLCEKLAPEEQARCTVIFDAQNSPGDITREFWHQRIRVIFAPADSDADTVIEELIATHSAARQLIVVSSDHRLHKAAQRRGSTPIDSDVYWDKLQSRSGFRQSPAHPDLAPPPREKPSTGETDQWLAEFGEISVQNLAEEVHAEDQTKPGGSPWEQHLADLEKILNDEQTRRDFLNDPRRNPDRRS